MRCMREKTAPAGWRVVRRHADGGTTFRRTGDKPDTSKAEREQRATATPEDINSAPQRKWAKKAKRFSRQLSAKQLRTLATELGVQPTDIGRICNGRNIRITRCQMGCF